MIGKFNEHILWVLCVASVGCAPILTMPMHSPLYPTGTNGPARGDTVSFSIEAQSDDGIKKIALYEWVSTIDSEGNSPSGVEISLGEDKSGEENFLGEVIFAGDHNSVSWSTIGGPYPIYSVVQYRFEVTAKKWGNSISHVVAFATDPYPVITNNMPVPAPVYVHGHSDDLFDVVFIPDNELISAGSYGNFPEKCSSLISGEIYTEKTIQFFKRQFNFYINPVNCGMAGDCDAWAGEDQHNPPGNWSNMSTYEAKVILHDESISQDFASNGMPGLVSVDTAINGRMRHELGHKFGLSDERSEGEHRDNGHYPNNWNYEYEAIAAAPLRHKDPSDVRQIIDQPWWKICDNECQMNEGELSKFYDDPCADRVIHSVMDNIGDD